jgi:hypothetical protein
MREVTGLFGSDDLLGGMITENRFYKLVVHKRSDSLPVSKGNISA